MTGGVMAKISTPSYMKTPGGRMGDAVFYSIGNRSYMRTYVIPRNPRTEAQQKNRSLFAEAMASWKSLPPEEKYLYKIRTGNHEMHPHNLYIKEYMALHTKECDSESDSTGDMYNKSSRKAGEIYKSSSNPPIALRSFSEAPPLRLQKSLCSPQLMLKAGPG